MQYFTIVALLNLSSWCLVISMVERLFLAVPQGCLQFVIVVFPDHTHLLFLTLFVLIKFTRNNVHYTKNMSFFLFANPLWSSVVARFEHYKAC